MSFLDIRFPERISRGSTSSVYFDNTVGMSNAGDRKVNINWDTPLRKFSFGQLLNEDEQRAYFISFFMEVRGNAYSFRFKDWADYFIGLEWNRATQSFDIGTMHEFATTVSSAGGAEYQLSITYGSVNPLVRDITKPIDGTITIKQGSSVLVEDTDYTINYTTGIVTIIGATAADISLYWAGQFDVHASFETDNMSVLLKNPTTSEWNGVNVVEIRGA